MAIRMSRMSSKTSRHLLKMRRDGDVIAEGHDYYPELDIVIPVMGRTGVGKSTFINNILGETQADVSDGFESSTHVVTPHYIEVPQRYANLRGRRIVLVDTPGFDDTYLDDLEILRRIAVWLATAYSVKLTVGGVIYLTTVYPRRSLHHDFQDQSFEKLCGNAALSNVVLGTTKWKFCPAGAGERVEKDLCNNFWKDMIDKGSRVCRLHEGPESAWALLGLILDTVNARAAGSEELFALRIQEELVDQRKKVPRTEAGRELRPALKDIIKDKLDVRRTTPQQRIKRVFERWGLVTSLVLSNFQ